MVGGGGDRVAVAEGVVAGGLAEALNVAAAELSQRFGHGTPPQGQGDQAAEYPRAEGQRSRIIANASGAQPLHAAIRAAGHPFRAPGRINLESRRGDSHLTDRSMSAMTLSSHGLSGYRRHSNTESAPETPRLMTAARRYAGLRTASPTIVSAWVASTAAHHRRVVGEGAAAKAKPATTCLRPRTRTRAVVDPGSGAPPRSKPVRGASSRSRPQPP